MSVLRSLALWMVSLLHFFIVGPLLFISMVIFDPHRVDWPQRLFCRNVVRLAGMRVAARHAPGFDATRTSIFVCNHVNLFDPFVIYAVIPQFARGMELASHFRIPVYGWLMKRVGNIPVVSGQQNFPQLLTQVRAYVERGTSVVVFPEGTRTLDGRVGHFRRGAFALAQGLDVPIVPVTMVGAYEFNRKGGFFLNPGRVVVHFHDTIEPDGELADLVEHCRRIVAGPLNR